MIHSISARRTVVAAAAAATLAVLTAAQAFAAAPDFSGFAGTWTSQDGRVTIGADGGGAEVLADNAHVAFRLASVDNGVGVGSITQSSNPGDATVGTPITVWTTALGDGPLLTMEAGGTDRHFCSPAAVAGDECMP